MTSVGKSVLIVEDDESVAELERRSLLRSGHQVHIVSGLAEAVFYLANKPVLAVVLDYRLKEGESWPVLEAAQACNPRVPVIMVTSGGDERVASEAIHRGASDYVIKSGKFVEQLPTQLERAIKLREAEEATAQLASIVESSHDAIVGMTLEGIIHSWNSGAERLFGYGGPEAKGRHISLCYPEDWAKDFVAHVERIKRGEPIAPLEAVGINKDGRRLDVSYTLSTVTDRTRRATGVSMIVRDITERKQAEESLHEKARLAALSADIGLAHTQGGELKNVISRCTEAVVRHLDAAVARIWTLHGKGDFLELQASSGVHAGVEASHERIPLGEHTIGSIAREKKPRQTNDVPSDFEGSDAVWAKQEGMVAFAGFPLLIDGELVGVLAMYSKKALSPFALQALASISGTIAVGIKRSMAEQSHSLLQQQLLQSQKMEAVGRLAGGIAHDFNNLLCVINGYSELTLAKLDPRDPSWKDIEEIRKAGERAAGLTRQLLAFSRKQVLQPKILNLNAVLTDMEKLLRRLIGEDVDLAVVLGSGSWSVRADPAQVEQVIVNLAVNARDAMPKGGRLTIETGAVELDGAYTYNHPGLTPGSYVMLAVTDSGTGMTEEVKSRIFEPFFTTKEPGKGTGLGLSTVYGIVKQSKGYIAVYSELGKGTTFKVYLPRVGEAPDERGAVEAPAVLARATETVLLVEDQEVVRTYTRAVLRGGGYTVLEAAHGGEALILCERHVGPIHLVLTDVVMPQLGGPELVTRLRKIQPGIKAIYMSGYTEGAMLRDGELDPNIPFIEKPFVPARLLRKVREVLGASPKRGT